VPLSEYEERMIAEFERQFDSDFSPAHTRNLSPRHVVQFGAVGAALGFALMLLALPVNVLLSFAGFLVSVAAAYWMMIGVQQGGWQDLSARYRRPTPRRRATDFPDR
jgi:Protein of unknown function (DUF3040)